MNLKQLEEKVRELKNPKLDYILNTVEEKTILSKTVKLNEEVGELCNDILAILKLQRKAKLASFDKRNIYSEFADVLITLMQLAIAANVDMDRAVKDKIKTIAQRTEKENIKTTKEPS